MRHSTHNPVEWTGNIQVHHPDKGVEPPTPTTAQAQTHGLAA